MTAFRRAFKQGSLYTLFQGMGMAVSLITFPIITRIMSVEEYGNLALYNATVSILLSVAKCGIATSFVRSYASVGEGGDDERKRLYSSAMGASLTFGLGIAAFYSIVIFFLSERFGHALTMVLLLASIPIVIGDVRDLLFAYLRAEERVLTLSIIGLILRIGSATTGIFACIILLGGLTGYIVGVIAFEASIVIIIALTFVRRGLIRVHSASLPQARQLVIFGAPLLLFEISSLVNDYADRFLIRYFLDSGQLGIYSVGYNFAQYVQGIVTAPLWMTIFPIYTKMWESEGIANTAAFLNRMLKYYLALAIMIIVVVSLTSHELIAVLATQKFSAAADIVPFVITSVMIYGTTHITSAGFYLSNQTKRIALLTLACASINILFNLFLIPAYGIQGAAYSTVVSYLILTGLINAFSSNILHVTWPIRSLVIYTCAGAFAALVVTHIGHTNNLVSLVLKLLTATACYAVFVLTLDRHLQQVFVRYSAVLYRQIREKI